MLSAKCPVQTLVTEYTGAMQTRHSDVQSNPCMLSEACYLKFCGVKCSSKDTFEK
jgi:hypothetical protein